jgi:DNA-binding MarR family transcriptional regulator
MTFMTEPTKNQLAKFDAALGILTRRYKLAEASSTEKTLNEIDRQTLLFVAEHPTCGPTDLARFLVVATTTITSATDRLVNGGLLVRERVEGDRRAISLRLTATGKTYVAAHKQSHQDIYRMMLKRLSSDERVQFIALVTKIVSSDD